jgi:hypothetical protein
VKSKYDFLGRSSKEIAPKRIRYSYAHKAIFAMAQKERTLFYVIEYLKVIYYIWNENP